MKKYRLLKDIAGVNAGTVFYEFHNPHGECYIPENQIFPVYHKDDINRLPDWFELVNESIEKRILDILDNHFRNVFIYIDTGLRDIDYNSDPLSDKKNRIMLDIIKEFPELIKPKNAPEIDYCDCSAYSNFCEAISKDIYDPHNAKLTITKKSIKTLNMGLFLILKSTITDIAWQGLFTYCPFCRKEIDFSKYLPLEREKSNE